MDLTHAEELVRVCEQTKEPEAKAAFLNEFLESLEKLPSPEKRRLRKQSSVRNLECQAKANRIMERLELLRKDILAKAAHH